jgi:hypothetical protein
VTFDVRRVKCDVRHVAEGWGRGFRIYMMMMMMVMMIKIIIQIIHTMRVIHDYT